jgi:integrase/recombinase XerD
MTVKQAMSRFMMHVNITRSQATFSYYRFYTDFITETFGDDPIEKMDEEHLLFLVSHFKDQSPNVKNSTLNKLIGAFKYFVRYATKKELEFGRLKETQLIIPTIPMTTIQKIFDYLASSTRTIHLRQLAFLRLLLDTGMRMNELLHVHINDIHMNDRIIHLKMTKTRSERYTFFTEKTSEVLIKYIAACQPTSFLFYNGDKHHRFTLSPIETMLYRLKKKLMIADNITPHNWRHTFATQFLSRGGDLETLRLILGHTNLKTTQKYLHLKKTDLFHNYRNIMV